MSSVIFAVISLLCGIGCFFVFMRKAKRSSDHRNPPLNQMVLIWPGLGFLFMIASFMFLSRYDDRPPFEYPIINRYDIRGQYEYVEEWEHPTTKCHYLIHHTRLSTGKMEMNRLENGKDDCPANR